MMRALRSRRAADPAVRRWRGTFCGIAKRARRTSSVGKPQAGPAPTDASAAGADAFLCRILDGPEGNSALAGWAPTPPSSSFRACPEGGPFPSCWASEGPSTPLPCPLFLWLSMLLLRDTACCPSSSPLRLLLTRLQCAPPSPMPPPTSWTRPPWRLWPGDSDESLERLESTTRGGRRGLGVPSPVLFPGAELLVVVHSSSSLVLRERTVS